VARLEEVDRLTDEFPAMVSHELRTPITVVLGMAQTLVGRPGMAATADGQEILQRVVRQGNRLRDMVEQLLQASAFVATRSPVLRAEEVLAAEVVCEVVDDWRMTEPDRRVELLLPGQPRSIHPAGRRGRPRPVLGRPPGQGRAAGAGWRTTRAAAPASWSSCPTSPR
jgi:signal transduction histidine kinase